MTTIIDPADLQAKSNQMNAVDFVHPILFKAIRVDYSPRQEQPVSIHMEGYPGRPYKPCKGMLRGLTQCFGDDTSTWGNRTYELFCDPTVRWGGEESGGIRISGISGIPEPFKFTVQLNRKQRYIHTFNVILGDQAVVKEFILTHHESNIADAETNEAINKIVSAVGKEFGKESQAKLKDAVTNARAKLAEPAPASE